MQKNLIQTSAFQQKETGSFESSIDIIYDSGEVATLKVIGAADNANIKLERNSIRLEHTSITLTTYKVVKLINRSEFMVTCIMI